METNLGIYQEAIDRALTEASDNQIIARVWDKDHTLWKSDPTQITNRMGWLHSPEDMRDELPRLRAFVQAIQSAGYTDVLLLGMGGSSLAPELFSAVFGSEDDLLDLAVLDSTVPAVVLSRAERLDPARSLFIVSSKSGTTLESLSFFKFFYNWVAEALGAEAAGQHFVAITDPDTQLAKLANRHNFRIAFLNNPNIGGRYSALSYFGLVPAALVGVDVPNLLDRASKMAEACKPSGTTAENPALRLGTVLAELAKEGRDKATFVITSAIGNLGDWIEQLIAESLGKEMRGILPVAGEPLGLPEVYGEDRFFVYIRLDEKPEDDQDNLVRLYEEAGFPVVRLHLQDRYDLGAQFFLWELAVAVAGHRLGINPFDQPNVEAAKVLAREMMKRYAESGSLPREDPTLVDEGAAVYTAVPEGTAGGMPAVSSAGEALSAFVGQGKPGDYVAFQAYLRHHAEIEAGLRSLAARLRDKTKLATTRGYGPRYLHSTGQLHKGDAGRGLFIQFTADDAQDVPIPDEAGSPKSSVSFGVLKAAQAMGDRQALLDAGRRVIRFHLGVQDIVALNHLNETLEPRQPPQLLE
jgi:glucose-6-phosphate isomerase